MGLLSTAAKAAVASSVHGRVQRRQQTRWAHQDAQVARQSAVAPDPFSATELQATFSPAPAPGAPLTPAAAPVAPAPPSPSDGAADLQAQLALIGQLNDLRQAGALTDAEFEAKKAQILQL